MGKLEFSSPCYTNQGTYSEEWTAHAREFHESLLSAGLTSSNDTGQIDLDTEQPYSNHTTLGYKIYDFVSPNSPTIKLKVTYRTGQDGSNRILNAFSLEMGFTTDGSGTILDGSPAVDVGVRNSSYVTANTPTEPKKSIFIVDPDRGFVFVSWKQRSVPPNQSYGPGNTDAHSPAITNFAICRTTDDAGMVTDEGVTLITTHRSMSYNNFGGSLQTLYLSQSGTAYSTTRAALVLGADNISSIGGMIPAYNIWTMTPQPRRISQLLAISRPAASLDESQFASVGNTPRNFRIDPNVWPADCFGGTSTRSCLAYLWE